MSLLQEEPRRGHGAPDVASPMLNKGEGATHSTCCQHFFFTVLSLEQVLGSISWCATSGLNSPTTLPQLWKKSCCSWTTSVGYRSRESCIQNQQQNTTLWLMSISFPPSCCPTTDFPVKKSYFYFLHITCWCWEFFSKPFSVEVIPV